jgi:Fur family peroxide stress response transcriptional regulator
MNLFDNLSEELIRNNIKPSVQRIKILEYLLAFQNHPTADQIFHDLKKKVNSLSKATVYNTIALFAQKGLLKVLTLEDNEKRYDIETSSHGHFVCNSCKNIYDFDINIDSFTVDKLDDFKVTDKDVYFKGICHTCLLNKK